MVTTNDADLYTFGLVPKSICNRTIKLGQLYVSALQQHDRTAVAITCGCKFILQCVNEKGVIEDHPRAMWQTFIYNFSNDVTIKTKPSPLRYDRSQKRCSLNATVSCAFKRTSKMTYTKNMYSIIVYILILLTLTCLFTI